MKALNQGSGSGSGLLWSQNDFFGNHTLLLNGEVVGTLKAVEGARGLVGDAATAEGSWTFLARGLFRRHIAIVRDGAEVGRYLPKAEMKTGRLEMPGFEPYVWARVERPFLHWSFLDSQSVEALRFMTALKRGSAQNLMTGRVDINPAFVTRPEAAFLVLLCVYLLLRGDDAPVLELQDPDTGWHDIMRATD